MEKLTSLRNLTIKMHKVSFPDDFDHVADLPIALKVLAIKASSLILVELYFAPRLGVLALTEIFSTPYCVFL